MLHADIKEGRGLQIYKERKGGCRYKGGKGCCMQIYKGGEGVANI